MHCRKDNITMIAHVRPTGPIIVTEVSVWQSIHHNVPSCAPLRECLEILEWNCLAVHGKAALWVMGAGPSEDHQGTAHHPALRHVHDVSEVSQSQLSDRTQQVEHWRCSRVPIVLASDDMQASAVEAVDTVHQCSHVIFE